MRRSTRLTLARFKAFLLIGCILASSQIGFAQTIYGSISGTVVDQSGAAIKDAKVIVKNKETGQTRETDTNDLGFYSITSLLWDNIRSKHLRRISASRCEKSYPCRCRSIPHPISH